MSPSFIAGFCNGVAWGHILAGYVIIALAPPMYWRLGFGVFLMCGGWRVAQFRWEDRARKAAVR